ncbi:hypothetical protein ES288_A11G380200v1 [Gossypium darwinii]|uniref:Uncharacterized protein n=1 Tax=Gossypium darwinii TaxID=34276 RepID=A0A5D2ETL8_GOSDA|nr:hypothetical protein ES288_A11G380200v1 [Gossypium darwinii]
MFGPFLNLHWKSIDSGSVVGHHSCTEYEITFSNGSLLLYREN